MGPSEHDAIVNHKTATFDDPDVNPDKALEDNRFRILISLAGY